MRFTGVILLILATVARAAVTNVPSCSYTDVNNAVSTAMYGDTVALPPGSATWTSTLSITKGIQLIGSGRYATTITYPGINSDGAPAHGDPLIWANLDSFTCDNDVQMRIEGIGFNGSEYSLGDLHFIRINGSTPIDAYTNLVVYNNLFTNFGIGVTCVYIKGFQCRGVIASNIFDRLDCPFRNFGNGYCTEWDSGLFPFAYGSGDNLFFEGNVVRWTQTGYAGATGGWIEIGQGGRVCVRYNVWDYSGEPRFGGYRSWQAVFDSHGFQQCYTTTTPPQCTTGTMLTEFYGNWITNFHGNQYITHRGGWGIFHNNICHNPPTPETGHADNASLAAQQYDSGCEEDYAPFCNESVFNGEVNNSYAWNMHRNGVEHGWVNTGAASCGGQYENVHFWDFTASFNGTSGVGRGSQSPITQWPNPTPGVAYWQCLSPAPTVNPSIIQSGTLWRANASRQWEPYYTPYIFPHPFSGTNTDTYLTATPTILPPSGTYQGSATISMECATTGAQIRYTADRTDPTITSTLYNGSFVLATNASIYARAFKTSYTNSGVAQNDYVIQSSAAVITPVFSPAVGVFNEITTVTITTATPGAELRYTLDGSIPTAASTLYTGPLTVSTPTTITVVGVKNGLLNSAILSGLFNVRVAPVVFNPVGGDFTNYIYVGMSSVTTNVTIFYTRDGSTPTSLSTPYLAPTHITATTTLKAIAIKGGFGSSAVTTDTYTIYGGVNEVGVNQATNATIGTLNYYR